MPRPCQVEVLGWWEDYSSWWGPGIRSDWYKKTRPARGLRAVLRAAAERWLIVCSMGAGVAVATYAGWSAVVAALILWALAVAWYTRRHARNAAAHKLRHGVPLRLLLAPWWHAPRPTLEPCAGLGYNLSGHSLEDWQIRDAHSDGQNDGRR